MRMFKSLIALMFPWLVILMDDNPGGALVALIMQASIVGWPFAAVWAWRIVHPEKQNSTKE